jgi:hypothetical protein
MTATAEPVSVQDALAHDHWKMAMDLIYGALMKIIRGILFPLVVGKISLTVNEYLKLNGKQMAVLISTKLA